MTAIRKIEKAEDIERKRKRNTLLLSIVMIAILLFSTAGYFTLRDEDAETSSSQGVENIGDAWILRYGDQAMKMSSSPESAQNVSLLLFKSVEDYYGQTVYVASDSDAGFYEVASTLGRYTGRMQEACYGECEKNLPEKSCNETMIVINMNITEKGRVYEGDNCVFIEGDLSAVDAFLYKVFGII